MELDTINEAVVEQEEISSGGDDQDVVDRAEFAEMVGDFSGVEEDAEGEPSDELDDETEDAVAKALLEADTEPEKAPAVVEQAPEEKPANPNADAAKYYAGDDAQIELTQDEHDNLLIDPAAMAKKLGEVKAQSKLELLHALPSVMYPMVMPLLDAAIEAAIFTRIEHPEYSGKRLKALEAAIPRVKAKNPTAPMRELLVKAHELIEASIRDIRAANSPKRGPVNTPVSARQSRLVEPGKRSADEDNEFDELTAHFQRRRRM